MSKKKDAQKFSDWLKKKKYVTELGGLLYYRFKGAKNDFMVKLEDVPENLLIGDELEYAKEIGDDSNPQK